MRNDAPAVPYAAGLPQLCDLATRTRIQVQNMLDADSCKRDVLKLALVPEIAMGAIPARLRAARELKASIECARRTLSPKPKVAPLSKFSCCSVRTTAARLGQNCP